MVGSPGGGFGGPGGSFPNLSSCSGLPLLVLSLKPPPGAPKRPPKPKKTKQKTKQNTPYAYDKKTPNFPQGLDFLRFQVAIYTVFHEESESEVEKCQFLEPGGKK